MTVSSKLIQAAAGAGSEPDLFILSVGDTYTYAYYAMDIDSSGNIIVAGYTQDPAGQGSNDTLVSKITPSGDLSWSKITGYTGLAKSDTFFGVTTDSSDNIYAAGRAIDANNYQQAYIQKLDTNGSVTWDKRIYDATSGRITALEDIDISSDESQLFFGGRCALHNYGVSTGVTGFYFGKIGTDGTGLTDYIDAAYYSIACFTVATDSNNNVWFGGDNRPTNPSTSTMDYFIRQSQSNIASGVYKFPWGGGQGAEIKDIVHGPSNTYMAIGYGNFSYLATITTSNAATQSIRQFSGSKSQIKSIAVDSSGNIYCLIHLNLSPFFFYLCKIDSSLTNVWQTNLKSTNGTDRVYAFDMALSDDEESLYICGYENTSTSGASYSGFVFKCPTDGSLTGTYGDFTYSSGGVVLSTAQSTTSRTENSTRTGVSLTLDTPPVTTTGITPSTSIEEG